MKEQFALSSFRKLYVILGVGAVLTFLGHGLWAVTALNDKFPPLLTGSLENALGIKMGTGTATEVVRGIGSVDLILMVAMVFLIVGILRGSGALYRLALSPTAIGIYVWATFWGFMTALSRPLGAGAFWPEILDLVERGPNWMLPAALLLLTLIARRGEEKFLVPEAARAVSQPPERRLPTPAPTV